MNSPRPADPEDVPPDLSLDDLDFDTMSRLVEASANGIVFVDCAWEIVHANAAALQTFGGEPGGVQGADLRALLDEAGAATLQAAADRESYRVRVVRPDGDHREIAFWTIPVEADGESLRAVLFDDATASARLERVAGALAHIAGALAFDQPVEKTLTNIAERVLDSTRAVACGIALINSDPIRIWAVGYAGDLVDFMDASPFRSALRDATGVDPVGYLTEDEWSIQIPTPTPQAFVQKRTIVESWARQRFLAEPAFAPVHEEMRGYSWDSLVVHPLMDGDQAIGVLTAFYAGPAPDTGEIDLLAAIARQATTAARSAILFGEVKAAAALEERQQLAHELHDSVSQVLYGIGLGARTAQAQLHGDPARAAESLDFVLNLADAGLAEMRALLFELRPDSLEREGLRSALAKQAAALRARHNIVVAERLDVEPDVPFEVKEILYRIALEALRDVVRAGNARHIEIALTEVAGGAVLQLTDDGPADDSRRAGPSHRIIVERAAQIGGALDERPDGDGRWSLRVTVPPAVVGAPR